MQVSPSTPVSSKEINQELEEYARKYEAIQRHRRSAHSPLTDRSSLVISAAPVDRQRIWSRQDSCESSVGSQSGHNRPDGGGGETISGDREEMRSLVVNTPMTTTTVNSFNGDLLSGKFVRDPCLTFWEIALKRSIV